MTPADRQQTYKYGWCFACTFLANATDLRAASMMWGLPIGIVFAMLYFTQGFAAAAVKPWGWYVLLAGRGLDVVHWAAWAVFIANGWNNRALAGVFVATLAPLSFIYFYRRRAMFGAGWRWRRLERLWPKLGGPEARHPDTVPGFAGLSYPLRLLFVAVVGALIVVNQLR